MPKAKIRLGGQWVDLGGMTQQEVQDIVNQAVNDLETQLNNADEYINGAFKDGIINVVEAKKIESFLKALDLAKADFDKRYDTIYSNPKLSSQTKTNLATQKATTDTAYTNLEDLINQVIADDKATDDEKQQVESAFTEYKNELSLLSELLELAQKEITDGLDSRLTTAESNIEQNANEIQLRVKQTDYEAGLDQTLQEAKAYTDSSIAPIQQDITNVQTYIDGTFKDGIIYDSEYRALQTYLNTLATDKAKIDNQYNQVYSNPNLTDPEKTNLSTAKSNLDTAYNNLINSINSAIADQQVTDTEKSDVDSKFTAYQNNLGVYASALEAAVYKTSTVYTNTVTAPMQTTLNNHESRLTTAESTITQQANQISLKVNQSDYNGNTIASLINQTATTVQIQASKINLQGQVTFSTFDSATQNRVDNNQLATPGTFQVDGGNLKSNTVDFTHLNNNTQNRTDNNKFATPGTFQVDGGNLKNNTVDFTHLNNNTQNRTDNNKFATPGTFQVDGGNLKSNTVDFNHLNSTTQQRVDNTKINTQQQIQNSTFVNGYNGGWTQWDSPWTVDTTTLYEGVNTAKASRTGQGSVNNAYIASNYVICSPNMYFTLSAYVMTNNTSGIDSPVYMDIQWLDNNNNQLSTNSTVITPSQNNTWQYFTLTAQAPANAAKLRARFYISKNGTIWIAKPMLQIGQIATPHQEFVMYGKQWAYQGTTQIDGSNIRTGTISFDQAFGGTIKLGGAAYGNASLYMYTDTGDTMVSIDANNRGFDYINVGRVNSDYVVKRDPDLFKNGPVTLYIDPVGGSDTNDGKTTSTQMKTIQHALDSLPKYLNQDVTIQVQAGSGTINEYLTIHGFYGRGNLTLNFVGFSNVLIGTIEVYNCGSQININNLKIAYPNLQTTGASVIYVHNSMVAFYNCQVYGRNVAQYCVRAKLGARVRLQEVSFFDATTALSLEYASYGAFWNTYGTNLTNYGAVYGSELLCYGSRANGGKIQNEGGAIQWFGGSEPAGSAGNYNAPYSGSTPVQTTTQFTPSSGDSWRDVYNSWRRDGTVRQGEWSGYGNHRGFWFFGTNVSSAVTGKTIISMRVYLSRLSQGGNSGGVPVYIRHHSLTSLPGSDSMPSVSSEYAYATFSWGESKWVTLPSSFYSYFQSGSSKGICVYTTDTSNSGYALFDPSNMILEITYQG